MCKWIKDILFPTNVLGKKKKCVFYEFEDGNVPNPINLSIVWVGEKIRMSYTIVTNVQRPFPHAVVVENGKADFNGGDGTEETYTISYRRGTVLAKRKLYFNCTNVTSLIVNGEQLI